MFHQDQAIRIQIYALSYVSYIHHSIQALIGHWSTMVHWLFHKQNFLNQNLKFSLASFKVKRNIVDTDVNEVW